MDVEGKQAGVDAELILLLADSPIPVTYAGGASSLQDFEKVRNIGRGHVDLTVGSALDIFGGKLPFESIIQWQRDEEAFVSR